MESLNSRVYQRDYLKGKLTVHLKVDVMAQAFLLEMLMVNLMGHLKENKMVSMKEDEMKIQLEVMKDLMMALNLVGLLVKDLVLRKGVQSDCYSIFQRVTPKASLLEQ